MTGSDDEITNLWALITAQSYLLESLLGTRTQAATRATGRSAIDLVDLMVDAMGMQVREDHSHGYSLCPRERAADVTALALAALEDMRDRLHAQLTNPPPPSGQSH